MSLANGDLTTLVRAQLWIPGSGSGANPLFSSIIIPDASRMIVNKLNRARLVVTSFTRTIDGVGNYQIILPDYPVLGVTSVQMGSVLVNPLPLGNPNSSPPSPPFNLGGYAGYRVVPWAGNLPGDPSVLEMVGGVWYRGVQNIKVSYTAGYGIQNEAQVIPATPGPYTVTVSQPQGIWCKDNGVTFADGTALTPVTTLTATGQYIPPTDPPATLTALGQYTFDSADQGKAVLISYSFVPSDLEMACIQMCAEMFSYRDRIGQMDKILGGQETIRFLRGGMGRSAWGLPPEVEDRIWPYVSVIPPAIGAPL